MKKIFFFMAFIMLPLQVFAASPNNVLGDIVLKLDGDGINVSWPETKNIDGSAVDHYRIYIDIKSVPASEVYTDYIDTTDNTNTYTVKTFQDSSLKNNQKYFFSITAFNKEGEESLSYSKENSLTFESSETNENEEQSGEKKDVKTTKTDEDKDQPTESLIQVESAKSYGKNIVVVVFNKEVKLPENVNDAFSLKDVEDKILDINEMEILSDLKSVKIVTADQTEKTEYKVIALSSVTDTKDAPIVSGITDSATFTGTIIDLSSEFDELYGEPENSDDNNDTLKDTNNEEVSSDTESTLEEKSETDDVDNNPFLEENEEVTHAAPAKEEDTTPPEDVTGLNASFQKKDEENNYYDVTINWDPSENTEGDLSHQNYAQKTGNQPYNTAIRVDKDKTVYQAVLQGGQRYTFKISTIDTSGNESNGAITSIILPETGPALLLGITGIMSAIGTSIMRRRKK